jgi:collagen triple helix repeat protein
MTLTRSRLVVATALASSVVVGGAGALMAVGSHDKPAAERIVGCVSKSTGDLRVVKRPARCGTGERTVVWNKRGLRGPAGAPGAAGADGADGTDGTDGVDGADGADGSQGPVGNTGPAGVPGPAGALGSGATYASSSSGGQGMVTTGAGTPAGSVWLPLNGVGAVNGQPVPSPTINIAPTGGGFVQLIAASADVTSIRAAFQMTGSDPLTGDLDVTAQLYAGAGVNLSPVAGVACTLSLEMGDTPGTVGQCALDELSVPIAAGKRAVIVFTASGDASVSQSGYLSSTVTTG